MTGKTTINYNGIAEPVALGVDDGTGLVQMISSAAPLPTAAPGSTAANPNSNPTTIVTGQLALAANVRGRLASNLLVNGIIVKSSPANTVDVLIGDVAVTVVEDGSGPGYILAPGEAASFAVTNSNAIYAIAAAAAILSFEGN